MRLKIVLAAVGVIVVGLVVTVIAIISSTDFNQYRGLIAEKVKEATGRELAIKGDLKLSIGLSPAVAVDDVSFANASWGSRPQMAQIKRFEAQVELLPLISGNVHVKRLVLIDSDIILETDAQGRANWQFDAGAKPAAAGQPALKPTAAAGPGPLPQVNAVEIRNARLVYRDGKTKETMQLALARATLTASGENDPLKLDIEGTFNALKFKVAGEVGSIAALQRPGTPFPVKISGEIADAATFKIDGTVREPLAGKGYDVALMAEGKELARLAEVAGRKMAAVGPFKLDIKVSDQAPGGNPSVSRLKAEIGQPKLVLVKAEGAVRDLIGRKGIALTASVEGEEIGALSGFSMPQVITLPAIPALGPFKATLLIAGGPGDRPAIQNLKAELGKADLILVKVDGAIQDPMEQKGVNLNVSAETKDLASVAAKLGAASPVSGPLQFQARVTDAGTKAYAVHNLALTAAGSDAAGEATLNLAGARPVIVANLSSNLVDLAKLSDGQSAAPGKPAAGQPKSTRLFSDDPLPYDALKSADAEIHYKAAKVVTTATTLANLNLVVTLKDGELAIRPLTAEVSEGKLSVEATLSFARQTLAAKVDAKSVDLGKLLKESKTTDYLDRGKTDYTLDVHGVGRSMHAIMASLNGTSTLVVGEGTVDSRYLDMLGADVTKVLSPIYGGASGGKSNLNCIVNRMDIANGVASSRVMLSDSSAMTVIGEGTVNLGTEALALLLTPKAKGVSVAQLAPPIHVKGTLANPSFAPDALGTIKSVAGVAGAVAGAAILGPVGVLGAVTGGSQTQSSAPSCQQALAQIGLRPSVPIGSAGQPATQQQPAQQQPAQQQQQPAQQQQQQRQPSGSGSPLDSVQKGIRGLFGR